MPFLTTSLINIATAIARRTATSQIRYTAKGIGVGEVGGLAYMNLGAVAGAQAFAGVGSGNGTLEVVTGLTVVEYMFAHIHRTTFTFAAVPLTLADATVGAGVKLYTFPMGAISVLGAAGQVAETTTSALAGTLNTGVTYNWGLGSTTQANGTLATTEQNILQTTNGVASATIAVAGATSKAGKSNAPAMLDGHVTPAAIFFNVGVAAATDIDADATVTFTGTLRVDWMINTVGN